MTKDSKQWTTVLIDVGDETAFIVLPDDLLGLIGWTEGEELDLEIHDDSIIFTKTP